MSGTQGLTPDPDAGAGRLPGRPPLGAFGSDPSVAQYTPRISNAW